MQSLSRRKIELQLLAEVDRADIPDEHKRSWYKTVSLDPVHFDNTRMPSPA